MQKMSSQVDAEYGSKLFSERKAYKLGGYNIAFVIEGMDKLEGEWRIRRIILTYHGQYWRYYMIARGTKQEVEARINELYTS
jgi:hypothetical protein